jgi:hypothetical protein
LDLLQPAVGALTSSVAAAFLTVGLLGISAGLIAIYVRAKWLRAALMCVYAIVMATDVATTGAFLREFAFHLVAVIALWYGVTRLARFNALGYFLLAAVLVLVPAAVELLQQPNPYFRVSGFAVVVWAVALLGAPLAIWRRPQAVKPL